jgi:hypothetical protein
LGFISRLLACFFWVFLRFSQRYGHQHPTIRARVRGVLCGLSQGNEEANKTCAQVCGVPLSQHHTAEATRDQVRL